MVVNRRAVNSSILGLSSHCPLVAIRLEEFNFPLNYPRCTCVKLLAEVLCTPFSEYMLFLLVAKKKKKKKSRWFQVRTLSLPYLSFKKVKNPMCWGSIKIIAKWLNYHFLIVKAFETISSLSRKWRGCLVLGVYAVRFCHFSMS